LPTRRRCMGALRARAPKAARSRPRAARGAEGVGAARPGAYIFPPITCARCLLVVGMSKTSCAARCSRRSVQGALRAPAEGEGGEGRSRHHDAQVCGERLRAAAQHVCNASRRDAPLERERLPPRPGRSPHFERARAPRCTPLPVRGVMTHVGRDDLNGVS